eukprot:1332560-Amorphochlora_amoeboformis.AAC.1
MIGLLVAVFLRASHRVSPGGHVSSIVSSIPKSHDHFHVVRLSSISLSYSFRCRVTHIALR